MIKIDANHLQEQTFQYNFLQLFKTQKSKTGPASNTIAFFRPGRRSCAMTMTSIVKLDQSNSKVFSQLASYSKFDTKIQVMLSGDLCWLLLLLLCRHRPPKNRFQFVDSWLAYTVSFSSTFNLPRFPEPLPAYGAIPNIEDFGLPCESTRYPVGSRFQTICKRTGKCVNSKLLQAKQIDNGVQTHLRCFWLK